MNRALGHLCAHRGLTGPGEPPEDGEMNEMTLSSRHRIRNSSPGGLRPSTLPLGHGGSPQYWLCDNNNCSMCYDKLLNPLGQKYVMCYNNCSMCCTKIIYVLWKMFNVLLQIVQCVITIGQCVIRKFSMCHNKLFKLFNVFFQIVQCVITNCSIHYNNTIWYYKLFNVVQHNFNCLRCYDKVCNMF